MKIFNNIQKKDIIYDNNFYNKIRNLKYISVKKRLLNDLNNNPIKTNYIITLNKIFIIFVIDKKFINFKKIFHVIRR